MNGPYRHVRMNWVMVAAACTVLAAPLWSTACDTPVYRYAMYRWLPAPYEVYCFHEGEMDESSRQLREAVDNAGQSAEAPTNIVFLPVDLAKDKDLTGVPPDVKQAWQKQENPQLPAFLISSPVGVHLKFGSLAKTDLEAIVDSPKRQQLGKLLEKGDAGVYILLEGSDAAANAEAEKVVKGVVDDVAAGKIELYTLPPMYGPPGSDEEGAQDAGPKLSFGFLKLGRNEANEKWMVDCLLALEPDLRESPEPIVFLIYGRGRALFSCLGKGIHRDNLEQDVYFVTGACSCTVKEQNPGVDLLMRYDWDSAALALSQQFGAEEGSRYEFGGDVLFPELIIPSESDVPGDATEEAEAGAVASQGDPGANVARPAPPIDESKVTATSLDEPSTQGAAEATASSPAPVAEGQGQGDTKVAAVTQPADAQSAVGSEPEAAEEAPASTFRGMFWVGAGLLGALVVLFGATFAVLRPK